MPTTMPACRSVIILRMFTRTLVKVPGRRPTPRSSTHWRRGMRGSVIIPSGGLPFRGSGEVPGRHETSMREMCIPPLFLRLHVPFPRGNEKPPWRHSAWRSVERSFALGLFRSVNPRESSVFGVLRTDVSTVGSRVWSSGILSALRRCAQRDKNLPRTPFRHQSSRQLRLTHRYWCLLG